MRLLLLLSLLLLCFFDSSSQSNTPILDRRVDVSFKNEKVTTVLNRIGQLGNFSFSYNAAIISNDDVVSIEGKNLTVREILNEIFKGSMNYKEKGNHLILTRVPVKAPKANVTSMIISGYVEDFFTNEKIVDASVYDKSSITSVVTDEFGFFRLKLEKHEEKDLVLTISKRDYFDENIIITETGNQYFHVIMKRPRPLTPIDTASIEEEPVAQIDSTASDLPGKATTEEEVPMPYTTSPNVENIRDTLYREIQISLLPFVGSNGSLSGNIINDYSINMFGGYSMGTRQIELGFFFNVDRGDVSFLQIAGFGNIDGGNMIGVQASGFFNLNGGETKAAQATGFTNINFGDFQGVQLAGLANINLASADGVKAAGLMNFSNGNSVGVSAAGLGNFHQGNFRGPQIAGFTNISSHGYLKGTQIAGFFNYGHKVYGTQVGFLNYADSLTGVPIGFLSIVKHGYHKLELSADEVFYGNIAFRSGARAFYNILSASYNPKTQIGSDAMWSFGYGVGTARKIFRWLDLNIDLTSQHVSKGGFTSALSSLNKLQAGFDFRLAKGFSIYVGGSLNAYLTKTSYSDYPTLFSDIKPTVFYEDTYHGDVNMKMWWGGKVALRFF
ncbi:MAG: STN domain-containing protein [Bacteroidota bacterium]